MLRMAFPMVPYVFAHIYDHRCKRLRVIKPRSRPIRLHRTTNRPLVGHPKRTINSCSKCQYGTWGFLKQRYPQIIHFNGMFHAKPSIWEYQHLWNPLHDDKKHGIELGLPWSAGLPQLFKVPKPLFSLATSPRYPLPVLDALQKIVSLLVNVDIPIKKTKD